MAENKKPKEEIATNLTDSDQKPEAPEWLLENIAEASKNARKIYFLYLGLLAYCALTVVSTTHRQIILNETARLPIVNLNVLLNGFFVLSPLIAILVFVYFQLYLHRLRGLIDDLRNNYLSIEKKRLYPWMINISEDPEPGLIGKLQKITVKLTLWVSLPIVLNLIALWHLKKHEPFWSYVVVLLSIFGTAIVIWFWWKYESTQWRKKTIKWKIINVLSFFLILVFGFCLLFFLFDWAKEGGKEKWLNIRWLEPILCVDLSYQKLINEPKTDYEGLYWGNLHKSHLEGADLINTVLKRADLRETHLQYANMYRCVLEGADLSGADLSGAHLREAKLSEASLSWADLTRADLREADLRGADLRGADLRGASLRGAKNLTIKQLSEVKTLYGVIGLDSKFIKQIEKDYPHLLEKPKEYD